MQIWPLLFWGLLALLIALAGSRLSRGLPWGIDDGVKRLMARKWASSAATTVILGQAESDELDRRFFPIPPPYAAETATGFRAIFPTLFPVLGGVFYRMIGPFGFYLLPSLSLCLLLLLFTRFLQKHNPTTMVAWATLILASSLLFYGLTFWEHPLALLFLLPLCGALSLAAASSKSWLMSGFCLGAAVYLRPETALLFPLLSWLLLLGAPSHQDQPLSQMDLPHRLKRFWSFASGLLVALLIAASLEKIWSGRWLPAQIEANLSLSLGAPGLPARAEQMFKIFWNAPIAWRTYAILVLVFLASSLILRSPVIFAAGLALFSIVSLIIGWLLKGAFGVVSFSQGLFFALPWLGISLLRLLDQRRRDDPLFILGWGYIILAYLLAPDRPGMHWGPRFLFPAMLPLLLRSMSVLKALTPRWHAQAVMAATVIAALLNAVVSVAAIDQRGRASAEVLSAILASPCEMLILDRWHAGADLEPLWGEQRLLRVEGRGDFEELLIELQKQGNLADIGWLNQTTELRADNFPLEIKWRSRLPHRAGWSGELLNLSLAGAGDPHWGVVYWHAARRRAETARLDEALPFFQQAVAYRPDNPDLCYDLAVCLGKMGRVEEAKIELQKVLHIDPQHAAARGLWLRLAAP